MFGTRERRKTTPDPSNNSFDLVRLRHASIPLGIYSTSWMRGGFRKGVSISVPKRSFLPCTLRTLPNQPDTRALVQTLSTGFDDLPPDRTLLGVHWLCAILMFTVPTPAEPVLALSLQNCPTVVVQKQFSCFVGSEEVRSIPRIVPFVFKGLQAKVIRCCGLSDLREKNVDVRLSV